MNGACNVVSESTASDLSKKILNSASKAASKSVNYVTDSRNTFTIIRALVMICGAIASIDYVFAGGNQRTSYGTRGFGSWEWYLFTRSWIRSKAAALRRKGIDLSDCCEPNSKRLNPEFVENKYEIVRPHESRWYLALEEENRKLRLGLEGPFLE